MRLTRRVLMQRRVHDRLDRRPRDRRLTTTSRAYHPEVCQSRRLKPCTPCTYGHHRHTYPLADPGVRLACRGQQQRLRALDLLMRRAR